MIELSLCFLCVHGHHVNYPSTRAILFSSFQFMPLYLCFLCWEPVATLVWLFSSFLKTQLKCHLLWKRAAYAQGWLVKSVFLVFPGQEAELLTVTSAREQALRSFWHSQTNNIINIQTRWIFLRYALGQIILILKMFNSWCLRLPVTRKRNVCRFRGSGTRIWLLVLTTYKLCENWISILLFF